MINETINDAAKIKTLPAQAFRRADETDDENFYRQPRFVTHIDETAIEFVTNLYRELIPANACVLDLMSSWVSHLPPQKENDAPRRKTVGLGMNRAELAANQQLDEYVVQNLNLNPALPFQDAEFDAALICVSIQYLTHPVAVLRETARVLKPSAPVIITFSNRCFPTKAVAVWRVLDDDGHLDLVETYLRETEDFDRIERRVKAATPPRRNDPLYGVIGRKRESK